MATEVSVHGVTKTNKSLSSLRNAYRSSDEFLTCDESFTDNRGLNQPGTSAATYLKKTGTDVLNRRLIRLYWMQKTQRPP